MGFIVEVPTLPHSLTGFVSIGLSCLSLALGTFAMFYGLALAGAFQFGLMTKLEPLFTTLFSWLILRESLNTTQHIGILLVVFSLVGYQLLNGNHPHGNPKKLP